MRLLFTLVNTNSTSNHEYTTVNDSECTTTYHTLTDTHGLKLPRGTFMRLILSLRAPSAKQRVYTQGDYTLTIKKVNSDE